MWKLLDSNMGYHGPRPSMKELLSKKFWQDVKKTFEDALKEPEPVSQPNPPPEPTKPDVKSER